jgi:uncharacterized protein YgiM (DUF1202 family)
VASPRHRKKHVQRGRWSLLRNLAVPACGTVVLASSGALALTWPEPEAVSSAQRSASLTLPMEREQAVSRDMIVARRAIAVTLKRKQVEKSEETPTPTPSPTPQPEPEPEPEPVPEVVERLYMTAPLNVWSGPGESYELLDVLPEGSKVGVTGEVVDGEWAQIVLEGESRWVNAAYLSDEKPVPEDEADAGSSTQRSAEDISDAPCPSGSSVEEGLTPDAVRVHRAVCARYPEVDSYGGVRSDGTHSEGRALDVMVSSESLGDDIAEWVRQNYSRLGVSEVIWAQRIWTVERSSEGWRAMEDRGSTTANHYDHVHVTVYGSSGG